MKDWLRQNNLHPRAIYIEDDAWLSGRVSVLDLPSASECKAFGADRFRIILPETAAPPNGWHLVKKSLLRSVPISKTGPIALTGHGYYRSIQKNGVDWKPWIDAHWRVYKRNHKDNPPANLSFQQREQVFGGIDLQPDDGVGFFRANKLVGFASLRISKDKEAVAEAGWIAAWGPNHAKLIEDALNWMVTRAQILGYSEVEFEADDNDLYLWEGLLGLPSLRDEIYFTWQQNVGKHRVRNFTHPFQPPPATAQIAA
jgi:hypothetical protein